MSQVKQAQVLYFNRFSELNAFTLQVWLDYITNDISRLRKGALILPLKNYEIIAHIDESITGFDTVHLALCKQLERLGGNVKTFSTSNATTYFTMTSTDKISATTTLVLYENYQPHIPLEIQLQARFGLIHIHGKQKGDLNFLPLNYLSCIVANQIVTSLLALEYAIRNGSTINHCTLSTANTVQNILGQYYAGVSLEKPNKQSEFALGPPFISNDGVIFEIETLNPSAWVSFCQALSIDATVASDAWKIFQSRYAKSECRLPTILYEKLSELSFDELSQICIYHNVFIIRLDKKEYTFKKPWCFEVKNTIRPYQINATESKGMATSTDPLKHVKVIESCRRIQGPYAASLLGLLGAKVTRIEPIGGDFLRGMPPLINNASPRFMALNHLKDVVEANLNKEEGRDTFFEVLAEADLFINNWAPNKAETLKLTHADILVQNKAVSYVYAGGWGPKNGHIPIPGTDFVVQAATGLASKISNGAHGLGGSLFTLIDLFGGVLAAQASLINMLVKQRDGHIAYFETSLLWAAEILLEQISDNTTPKFDDMRDQYALVDFSEGSLLISHRDIDKMARKESLSLTSTKTKNDSLDTVLTTLDKHDIQYVCIDKEFPGFDINIDDMWFQNEKSDSGYMLPLSPWSFSNIGE